MRLGNLKSSNMSFLWNADDIEWFHSGLRERAPRPHLKLEEFGTLVQPQILA